MCLSSVCAQADLASNVFGDHMVLQRERPVPIWGRAEPGQPVELVFTGLTSATASTQADAAGAWRVELPALAAQTDATLTISSGEKSQTIRDVAVGEVWLCSGQSNIEWALRPDHYPTEIATSAETDIRFFRAAHNPQPEPQTRVDGAWQRLSPANATECSAVGYFLARELQRELGVPVGLLVAALGGSTAEAWAGREAFATDPDLETLATREIAGMANFEVDAAAYPAAFNRWADKQAVNDTQAQGTDLDWSAPDTDLANWSPTTLPFSPAQASLPAGGIVWLRRAFTLPPAALGQDHVLHLGWTPASLRMWWNGTELSPPGPEAPRLFPGVREALLPAALVREGENQLVIRCYYPTGDWGLWQTTAAIRVPVADPSSLRNEWLCRVEKAFPVLDSLALSTRPLAPDRTPRYTPTYLYNGMIAPLVPYAIAGAAWYQGEANTGRPSLYRKTLPALIADWRTRWSRPALPFFVIQLPNHGLTPDYTALPPSSSSWAALRESQHTATATTPDTGLVVTIDLGEADDIHPRNKHDVGSRLARLALAQVYGREQEARSPALASFAREGDALRVRLHHAAGLHARRPGPIEDIALAGPDRHFVWAEVTLDGDELLLRAPGVSSPVAARYAWADNPARISLYNAAGLPLAPFRTDDWPLPPDAPFAP